GLGGFGVPAGEVKVWDAATGEEKLTLGAGQVCSGASVALSPDGKRLAAGVGTRPVRLWDAETGGEVATLVEGGHIFPVARTAFSRDGKALASLCMTGSLRLWDLPGTKARRAELSAFPFKQGSGPCTLHLQAAADGRHLVCTAQPDREGAPQAVAARVVQGDGASGQQLF